MKFKLTKKYSFEIIRNTKGLWHRYILEKTSSKDENKKRIFGPCLDIKEKLVPVYIDYGTGIPIEESAKTCLTTLKVLTILNFQFRLSINGYLYKETPMSKRFKELVSHKKQNAENVFLTDEVRNYFRETTFN